MILFGHPTGNPKSHHAALAHYEAGRLGAFCVPWFPSQWELGLLASLPGARSEVSRLQRRRFEPLAAANIIQGRLGEWRRMAVRLSGRGDQKLSYEANDWLMRTMARECKSPEVTALHSYEDCSLWQFQEAKRRGKACIYDMPIGYFPWWQEKQERLARDYADWIPREGIPSNKYVRPEQKQAEMELADLVLVACSFVERTIREFHPEKKIVRAPYGVDAEFWAPTRPPQNRNQRAEFGGQRPEIRAQRTEFGGRIAERGRRPPPVTRNALLLCDSSMRVRVRSGQGSRFCSRLGKRLSSARQS